MNAHKLFTVFIIAVVTVTMVGAPITASAQGDTTITLDFEDGQLPSAHGWQKISNGDEGTHIITAGTVPGNSGSQVLQISGYNKWGWWLDLNGIAELDEDWTFSIDMRSIGGSGSNDILFFRIGQGNNAYIIGNLNDGSWHNFKITLNHSKNEVEIFIDGISSDTMPPDNAPFYAIYCNYCTNAVGFLYSNMTQYRSAQFDNIYFESYIPIPVLYATPGGLTSGLCESWENACELSYALSSAVPGQEIWTAEGVYKPGTDRTASFQLKSGVEIYGGFAGTEIIREQRDWQSNVTILSGDIDNNDVNLDGNFIAETVGDIQGVNTNHIIYASGVDSTAVLDGLTITAGYADYAAWHGGGMYNDYSSPTLRNIVFIGNRAIYGGGLYNNYSNSTLTNVIFVANTASVADGGGGGAICNNYSNYTLTNVTFRENTGYYGGAIHNGWYNYPTMTNVTFDGNHGALGGGIFNQWSIPTMKNVVFVDNVATERGGGVFNWFRSHTVLSDVLITGNSAPFGGGIYNHGNSNPSLTNVVIRGNTATYGGGIYSYSWSFPTLNNVTISGNSAEYGGGLFNTDMSQPTVVNTIIHGNNASVDGNQICNNATIDGNPRVVLCQNVAKPIISYSDIQGSGGSGAGWNVLLGTDGGGNIDADPLFVDAMNGDLHLRIGSPAVDSGRNAVCPTADLEGTSRPQDGNDDGTTVCDMGAYEVVPIIDSTPPTITPSLNGIEGNEDWYTSDVTVSWNVSDPESGIVTSVGCDPTTLTTDTVGDTLTCSATNGAGFSNSASVTVKIDKTPPTIVAAATTDPNTAGWYKDDVAVHFTCTDALSGIPAGACPLDQVLSAEGMAVASTTQTVTDVAGNMSGDSNVVTVSIDKTVPVVTWSSAINDGDSFYFDFVPPAPTCTATDSLSGWGGSCVVSGYATTVGIHTLTAAAKDFADNEATESRYYTVLAWTLKGFYQPVDMNGIYNIVKNGSTVPFKFEIFAGNTELTDIANIKSLTYAQTTCDATATTDEIETTATGDITLRYADGQFIYNWKTPNTAGTCYRVTMTTLDGSSLAAYFKLK